MSIHITVGREAACQRADISGVVEDATEHGNDDFNFRKDRNSLFQCPLFI